MEKKWFQKSYRHNIVDTFITDWDERFLSEFDSKKYVDMLTLAKVSSTLFYTHSHVGHCNWPTKTGHMHRGLKGKDIVGEVIDLCHQKEIDVILYYSLIFNNWAYDNNPDWRIINAQGKGSSRFWRSRLLVCCPNSPYRDFAVAQVEELCKNYEFEGMWFDMTFWPDVCYCSHCKKRYALEVGGKIPTVINWENPEWAKFQRKREEWLAEFASLITSTAKKLKPAITVTHQSGAFTQNWIWGASIDLAKENDYMASDLYGDSLQQSFFSKLFYKLGRNVPFEFITSACFPNSHDHVTMKPKELLEAQVYSSLANGSSFCLNHTIDPVGTLDKRVYEQLGDIFKETQKYERYLGGEPCQDVGIYVSFESGINLEDNGKKVSEVESTFFSPFPHSQAARGAAQSLLHNHIPFGVITKKNLKELSSYQIIILPDMVIIDEEEVEALKSFVASGGSLYVSKYASVFTKDGKKKKDFLLSELLGVSYVGETKEEVTYLSPTEEGKDILSSCSVKYPLTIFNSQLKVKAKEKVKILATIALPYTDPKDTTRFVCTHDDPPGILTDYPAIVLNEHGKGKVLYVTADLETAQPQAHRKIFIDLIKMLSSKPFFLEADAPKSVEVTSFHQKDKKRYLINLLNFQAQLPNIPVEGIKLRAKLNGKEPKRLIELPEEKELAYEVKKDYLEFTSPKLETFLMIALDYK